MNFEGTLLNPTPKDSRLSTYFAPEPVQATCILYFSLCFHELGDIRDYFLVVFFSPEETEAQKMALTCHKSHGCSAGEPGLRSGLLDSKTIYPGL